MSGSLIQFFMRYLNRRTLLSREWNGITLSSNIKSNDNQEMHNCKVHSIVLIVCESRNTHSHTVTFIRWK